MNKHIITNRKAFPSKSMGPNVLQVIPSAVEHIDPFVFLDHFGPMVQQPGSKGVPPHPHAGIATITYLFEGSNRHQDSYGHDAVIHPGDLAWMRAGKGIVHAEGMGSDTAIPQTIHGLQFWISLPARDKFTEPDFFHYPSETLPVVEQEHARIKVIAGQLGSAVSPVISNSPAYLLEVNAAAGSTCSIPLPEGYTAGVYVVSGSITGDEKVLLPRTMTRYSTEGDRLELSVTDDSHFVVFGGQPLNEPIVAYASFVMNSPEEIRQVIADYENGKMGTIAGY